MTKHVVITAKVEQRRSSRSPRREKSPSGEVNQRIIGVENTVEVKKHEIIKMKAQRRKPDPDKDQTVHQTHREPQEAAH